MFPLLFFGQFVLKPPHIQTRVFVICNVSNRKFICQLRSGLCIISLLMKMAEQIFSTHLIQIVIEMSLSSHSRVGGSDFKLSATF